MSKPLGRFIADAHQDLAYHCLKHNRDLVDPKGTVSMITLPWLLGGGIRLICATLFTEPQNTEAIRRYIFHCQYEQYLQWFDEYPDQLKLIRSQSDLKALADTKPINTSNGIAYPVGVILLMEGLDLVENPNELLTWFERGVRMASLTWDGKNRYGSGCRSDKGGLKTLGFKMLRVFEETGMILDLSHLSEKGIDDALHSFKGAVCSGHTNARALCDRERNLTDDHARAVADKGGVIGLNLLAPLIIHGWRRGDKLPTIKQAVNHSEYFAEILGKQHVGIGADLDGGLVPENTPFGIDRIDHLSRLGEELKHRGWDEDDINAYMGGNWWDFFERSLPR